ncbi:unnamed protein product [Ceratitis capitata]|uniref:(Mediterranean fruit fly) hypothetical protein n=1 Tax=Ceratitis capitata TaxID=7213 RepID=A0A811UKL9_CERCA|nr:unnamed protein product [Ceratitis capitata]
MGTAFITILASSPDVKERQKTVFFHPNVTSLAKNPLFCGVDFNQTESDILLLHRLGGSHGERLFHALHKPIMAGSRDATERLAFAWVAVILTLDYAEFQATLDRLKDPTDFGGNPLLLNPLNMKALKLNIRMSY